MRESPCCWALYINNKLSLCKIPQLKEIEISIFTYKSKSSTREKTWKKAKSQIKWHPSLTSSQSSSFSSVFSQPKPFHNLMNVKPHPIHALIKTKLYVLKSLPSSRSSLRAWSVLAHHSSPDRSRCCTLIETCLSSSKPSQRASFSPPVSCMFCLILSTCFGRIVSRKIHGISFPFQVSSPWCQP